MLVEVALVLPILLLLMTFIADIGVILYREQALTQGLTSASRALSVGRVGADEGCTTPVPEDVVGDAAARQHAARAAVCAIEARIGLGPETLVGVIDNDEDEIAPTIIVCAQTKIGSASGFFDLILPERWYAERMEVQLEYLEQPLADYFEPIGGAATSWSYCV